jgi:hypothetical protein
MANGEDIVQKAATDGGIVAGALFGVLKVWGWFRGNGNGKEKAVYSLSELDRKLDQIREEIHNGFHDVHQRLNGMDGRFNEHDRRLRYLESNGFRRVE